MSDQPAPQAFAVFIQDAFGGHAHADASRALAKLFQEVKRHGKKGSIALTISVEPAKKGSEVDAVSLAYEVTSKLPQARSVSDFMFLTEEGRAQRNHPRQSALDLRPAAPNLPLRSGTAEE